MLQATSVESTVGQLHLDCIAKFVVEYGIPLHVPVVQDVVVQPLGFQEQHPQVFLLAGGERIVLDLQRIDAAYLRTSCVTFIASLMDVFFASRCSSVIYYPVYIEYS